MKCKECLYYEPDYGTWWGAFGWSEDGSKSILDGLNGIAYEDDDQVVELLVRKHRVKAAAEERVEIEIREFKEVG